MDKSEIKTILRAFRAGSPDESDPTFAAAIDALKHDSELAAWWRDEQAFDHRVESAIAEIPVPAGLRESIIRQNASPQVATETTTRPRKNWIGWIAAGVAAAAMVVVLIIPPPKNRLPMSEFVTLVETLNREQSIRLGQLDSNHEVLREWLAHRGSPHDFAVPSGLKPFPSVGCQTYTIGGFRVSLMCFLVGEDQVIHVFVMNQAALDDAPGRDPVFRTDGKTELAMWSADGMTYLLASTTMNAETFRRVVESPGGFSSMRPDTRSHGLLCIRSNARPARCLVR